MFDCRTGEERTEKSKKYSVPERKEVLKQQGGHAKRT
jgi:hypothetical protein